MKLTFELPTTTNVEHIIAYLIAEGAVVTEQTRKNALKTQKKEAFLAGIAEGMRLLSAKKQGQNIKFQNAKDLLNELD
jgi:hypothetical protein